MRYIALLRGINVGGHAKVSMAELKACFEKLGFTAVHTYINSGNVIFDTPDKDVRKLESRISEALNQTFDCKPPVVVITHEHLKQVIKQAPKGFGADPKYRANVMFLKWPTTSQEVMAVMQTKPEVDVATGGDGVVYYATLIARVTQSKLRLVIVSPIYKQMTIRNWNTTTKLNVLADES